MLSALVVTTGYLAASPMIAMASVAALAWNAGTSETLASMRRRRELLYFFHKSMLPLFRKSWFLKPSLMADLMVMLLSSSENPFSWSSIIVYRSSALSYFASDFV